MNHLLSRLLRYFFLFLLYIMTVGFVMLFGIAFAHASTIYGNDTVATDTMWSPEHSPYIISGYTKFTASSSLTILPGTSINFVGNGYLEIKGGFSSQGEENNPITVKGRDNCYRENYITIDGVGTSSLSYTNFTLSSVLNVQKRSIKIKGGSFSCMTTGMRFTDTPYVLIEDTTFLSTGYGIDLNNAAALINNVNFEAVDIGIHAQNSEMYINDLVAQHVSVAVSMADSNATMTRPFIKESRIGIDVFNRRVFLVSADTDYFFPERMFSTHPYNIVQSHVYLKDALFFNNTEHATSSYMGGVFREEGTLVDQPVISHIPRNPLIVIPGILGSAIKNGVWEIDPIFHTYDRFIQTLVRNGYATGTSASTSSPNLFLFPYDWHQSNTVTAQLLKNKIDQIKSICKCKKVDIAAHSMGGLVARAYIQSQQYGNDVATLVFMGTPHRGSPNSYLPYHHNTFGDGVFNAFLNLIFTREARFNTFENISDYIQRAPIYSVRELQSIDEFLYDASGTVPYTPAHYIQNQFLTTLEQTKSTLTQLVRVFNIVGQVSSITTTQGFEVVYEKNGLYSQYGFPIHTNDHGGGDLTVPENSALDGFATSSVYIDAPHNEIPTRAATVVLKKLIGYALPETENTQASVDTTLLIVNTLFPYKIKVIDPNGQNAVDISPSFSLNDTPLTVVSSPEEGDYTFELEPLQSTIDNIDDFENVIVDISVEQDGSHTAIRKTIPVKRNPITKKKEKITTSVKIKKENTSSTPSTPTPKTKTIISGGGESIFIPILPPTIKTTSGTIYYSTSSDATSTVATITEATSTPSVITVAVLENTSNIGENSGGSYSSGSNGGSTSGSGNRQNLSAIPSPASANLSSLASSKITPYYRLNRSGATREELLEAIEREWYNILMQILEKLFGSAAKLKIIKLFLFNQEATYDRSEIMDRTKSSLSEVRTNLALLEKVKFIKSKKISKGKKKVEVWQLNPTFPYLSALQTLLINIMPISEQDISRRLQKAGKMKLIVMAGVFIQDWDSRADLLVVGDNIRQTQLTKAIKGLEADIGKELTYASFETQDFLYRFSMYDKLVRDILDFPHTVVVDKLGIRG